MQFNMSVLRRAMKLLRFGLLRALKFKNIKIKNTRKYIYLTSFEFAAIGKGCLVISPLEEKSSLGVQIRF